MLDHLPARVGQSVRVWRALQWPVTFAAGWSLLWVLVLPHPYGTILAATLAILGCGALWFVGNLAQVARHAAAGHRFLCPECLRLGDFLYACGRCGLPLKDHVQFAGKQQPAEVLVTCDACHAPAFAGELEGASPARARCGHCEAAVTLSVYHERRVRILAPLRRPDCDLLRLFAGTPVSDGPGFRSYDDGEYLTYILLLEEFSEGPPQPEDHALRSFDELWIPAAITPLELGQALDRLERLAPGRSRRARALLGPGTPDPHVPRLLRRRCGSLRTDVSPEKLFARSDAPSGTHSGLPEPAAAGAGDA